MSTITAEELIRANVAIPTLPQVVARINALVDDPDVGVREIGAAVAEDAPIAASVLRLANSARYGLREKVLSTEHATAVLGVRMLRTIAMQASVVSRYDHLRGQADFNLEALWRHSILDGFACSLLATRSRARIELSPEEFQVVGLLHDVGKVLLLESSAEVYLACMREARERGVAEFRAEEARFGFHHGEVGALIAARKEDPHPAGGEPAFTVEGRDRLVPGERIELIGPAVAELRQSFRTFDPRWPASGFVLVRGQAETRGVA